MPSDIVKYNSSYEFGNGFEILFSGKMFNLLFFGWCGCKLDIFIDIFIFVWVRFFAHLSFPPF